MRRLRLLPLVIATLLLTAVSPALVPAQEATPPAAMEVPQVVQDYVAAFEALDSTARQRAAHPGNYVEDNQGREGRIVGTVPVTLIR
jgi:hypothetical protein